MIPTNFGSVNALLETFSCVCSEIVFTIISFFQKLISGGGGGTIIRYSRVITVSHKLGDYNIIRDYNIIPFAIRWKKLITFIVTQKYRPYDEIVKI